MDSDVEQKVYSVVDNIFEKIVNNDLIEAIKTPVVKDAGGNIVVLPVRFQLSDNGKIVSQDGDADDDDDDADNGGLNVSFVPEYDIGHINNSSSSSLSSGRHQSVGLNEQIKILKQILDVAPIVGMRWDQVGVGVGVDDDGEVDYNADDGEYGEYDEEVEEVDDADVVDMGNAVGGRTKKKRHKKNKKISRKRTFTSKIRKNKKHRKQKTKRR